MKSIFATVCLLLVLTASLGAQTNIATPAAASAPKLAVTESATATATADGANQATTITSAKPYPITAIIVSNTITFPILLSKTSDPLMTNAVYRRTFGRKVIFAADLTVSSYDIEKLHPSVIEQLGLDKDKVKSDQETLDKQNQELAAQRQQQNQQFLSSEAAALAKNQSAAGDSTNAASASSSAPAKPHRRGNKGAPPQSN